MSKTECECPPPKKLCECECVDCYMSKTDCECPPPKKLKKTEVSSGSTSSYPRPRITCDCEGTDSCGFLCTNENGKWFNWAKKVASGLYGTSVVDNESKSKDTAGFSFAKFAQKQQEGKFSTTSTQPPECPPPGWKWGSSRPSS